jgi:hypothetical protein
MKFFLNLWITGIALILTGLFITGGYNDCLSDVRIGNPACASGSFIAFGWISFFIGIGCLAASLIFLDKKKYRRHFRDIALSQRVCSTLSASEYIIH